MDQYGRQKNGKGVRQRRQAEDGTKTEETIRCLLLLTAKAQWQAAVKQRFPKPKATSRAETMSKGGVAEPRKKRGKTEQWARP